MISNEKRAITELILGLNSRNNSEAGGTAEAEAKKLSTKNMNPVEKHARARKHEWIEPDPFILPE